MMYIYILLKLDLISVYFYIFIFTELLLLCFFLVQVFLLYDVSSNEFTYISSLYPLLFHSSLFSFPPPPPPPLQPSCVSRGSILITHLSPQLLLPLHLRNFRLQLLSSLTLLIFLNISTLVY